MVKYIREIIIGALIIFILWFVQCGDKKVETQTITLPAKEGKIEKEIEIKYLSNKPQKVYVAGKEIKTENPVNEEMLKNYILTKDSLKLAKYVKAIEEREQVRTFKDKDLSVDVYSKVRGELLEQNITWKIPPQKIEVPLKKDNFGFLVSGGATRAIDNPNMTLQVGAGIRVKKISVLANINTEKQIGLTLIKEF